MADHRGQYGPGTGWVVLADPEGNEFCILRNLAEREAAPAARQDVDARLLTGRGPYQHRPIGHCQAHPTRTNIDQ